MKSSRTESRFLTFTLAAALLVAAILITFQVCAH